MLKNTTSDTEGKITESYMIGILQKKFGGTDDFLPSKAMIYAVVARESGTKRNKKMAADMLEIAKKLNDRPIKILTACAFVSYILLALIIWQSLKKFFVTPIKEINDAIAFRMLSKDKQQ